MRSRQGVLAKFWAKTWAKTLATAIINHPHQTESIRHLDKRTKNMELADHGISISPGFLAFKRTYDLALGIALLPVLGLVCFVVWMLNLFLNPGKLLFTQDRIGLRGQPFRMFKFRTMAGDHTTTRFANTEMHRIGNFGAFLRRRRIDELPQVINVLRGEMSFVGPRPEQPDFCAMFGSAIDNYNDRHLVKPGISGLAQVRKGYANDIPGTRHKLRWDLYYIRNMGLGMDCFVIRRTLVVLVTGFGAL